MRASEIRLIGVLTPHMGDLYFYMLYMAAWGLSSDRHGEAVYGRKWSWSSTCLSCTYLRTAVGLKRPQTFTGRAPHDQLRSAQEASYKHSICKKNDEPPKVSQRQDHTYNQNFGCASTFMHTHTYIHTYMHTFLHTYIHAYIHTYAHKTHT